MQIYTKIAVNVPKEW